MSYSSQKNPSNPETHSSTKSIVDKGHSKGRDGLESGRETTPDRDPSTIEYLLSLFTSIAKLIDEPLV